MSVPDHRTHAFRPDLADASLRGTIGAERFVEPFIRQCVRGVLPLLRSPSSDAEQVSQIRYGEFLDVFEIREDGFAWVQNRFDRYVGYMPAEGALRDVIATLSHRVGVLRTFVYPEPDVKTPPMDELTLGAHVEPGEAEGKFIAMPSGGYVFAEHIVPAEAAFTPDYVFTAGRLLGIPYLWGGRTPKGLDCSGFVQLALELAGIDAPRDSDQQRQAFGQPLENHWRDTAWKRGDLVFFPGHIGIMTGTDHMIHAHGHHMLVTVEPLLDFMTRNRDMEILGMARFA